MRFHLCVIPMLLLALTGCQDIKVSRFPQNPHPILKVVSLSPATSELAAIHLSLKVLGGTSSDDYPASSGRVPRVLNGVKPNYEEIAQLQPDAVLYDPQLFSEGDLSKLKEMHLS